MVESNEIVVKGKIVYINPVKTSGANNDFRTMSIGLDTTKVIAGTPYQNHMNLQAVNENIEKFDNIFPGDIVMVAVSLRGSAPKPKDDIAPTEKNPNKLNIFSNINVYEVEIVSKVSNPATPAPAANPAPPPPAASDVDDLPF